MKILSEETTYEGKYLRIKRVGFENRGRRSSWEKVERTRATSTIVAALAVTKNGKIILIKNFRIPHNSWVLELPAGLCDKDGETPEEVVARELLEETGYAGDKPILLVKGPFDPGLHDNQLSIYLIANAKKIKKPELEQSEQIKVRLVTPEEAQRLVLKPPKNLLADIKILSALNVYERFFKEVGRCL